MNVPAGGLLVNDTVLHVIFLILKIFHECMSLRVPLYYRILSLNRIKVLISFKVWVADSLLP